MRRRITGVIKRSAWCIASVEDFVEEATSQEIRVLIEDNADPAACDSYALSDASAFRASCHRAGAAPA